MTVEGDDELRFRHPLVRSAIRQAASVQARHAAHAALAVVVDLDRRVWHRAASVVGPDEATASELEWTAAAAERRGSLPVAISAFTRAAELSDHPARRGARLLRAAELAFELGRSDVVVSLLRDAEPLALSPGERTRLAWLRELFATQLWSGTSRTAALIAIADRMRIEGDPERALRWLRNVAFRCWWSYPDEDAEALVLQAAARMPVAPDHPELLDTLALAAPVERGREVIAVLARRPMAGDTDAAFSLGDASTAVGAFSAELIAEAVAGLRAQGRVAKLTQMLVGQAWASLFLGNWDLGRHAAEEAIGLAGETRQPRYAVAAQLAEASLRALRGEDGADAAADEAERVLLPMGASPLLSLAQLTRGVGALGDGRHAEAFAALRRIYEPGDVAHHRFIAWWALVDLVDAAIHSEHHDEARALVARLEPILDATGAPLLQAGITYARAVLSDEEALFAAPVERVSADPRAAAAGLRGVAAAPAAAGGLARAAAGRARGVRRARRRALGRAGAPGAAGVGRDVAPAHARGVGRADAAGAADRADGRGGPHEPRDRRAAVPLAPHDRQPPLPDLPEARGDVARGVARRSRLTQSKVWPAVHTVVVWRPSSLSTDSG